MKLARAAVGLIRLAIHLNRPYISPITWATLAVGLVAFGMASGAVAAFVIEPKEVLQAYLKAVYAQGYSEAYKLISLADRGLKTEKAYVEENGAFSGAAFELTSVLASLIRFENIRTEIEGDHATVILNMTLPNANAPSIQKLLLKFDPERLDALSQAERVALVDQLRAMAQNSILPVLAGEDERWELVREDDRWRVSLNWAGAVEVRFEAATRAGLPWEFTPVKPVVRATPGETLQTVYRVKNLADREITGKARHILDPPQEAGYLEIVFCFCFIQQTLAPGEERELPLVFRVNYDTPESVQEMRVRYEFYPIEKFPQQGTP